MDIEEYLRQKRELEAKKEMLEAKEKVVDHDKERFKKEQRAKLYAEHGVNPKHSAISESHEHAPAHHPTSSGPGMWNTILLFLILILLAVSYFTPRFGEDKIRDIIKEESDGQQIETEQEPNNEEEQNEVTQNENTEKENEEKPVEEPEGPLFSISISDNGIDKTSTRDDEVFDNKDGTLDGEILRIDNARRGYYDDFIVKIINEEDEWIVCELDRDVQIDQDFDGAIDLESHDVKRHKLKIKPNLYDLINKDVVPGTIDSREGTYEGRGSIRATYEAHCSFCEDDLCIEPDNARGKRTLPAFFKVYINEDESIFNNSTNRT